LLPLLLLNATPLRKNKRARTRRTLFRGTAKRPFREYAKPRRLARARAVSELLIGIWFLARPLVLSAAQVKENCFSLSFIGAASCPTWLRASTGNYCGVPGGFAPSPRAWAGGSGRAARQCARSSAIPGQTELEEAGAAHKPAFKAAWKTTGLSRLAHSRNPWWGPRRHRVRTCRTRERPERAGGLAGRAGHRGDEGPICPLDSIERTCATALVEKTSLLRKDAKGPGRHRRPCRPPRRGVLGKGCRGACPGTGRRPAQCWSLGCHSVTGTATPVSGLEPVYRTMRGRRLHDRNRSADTPKRRDRVRT
jgi:hypothetical protein